MQQTLSLPLTLIRKGILEMGSGFSLALVPATGGDEDELEFIGMALVQPKPFTVKFVPLMED